MIEFYLSIISDKICLAVNVLKILLLDKKKSVL